MPQLPIYDERMLQLINILKQRGTIRFTVDFGRAIGIERQNINNIRNGMQSFTAKHILLAATTYKISVDWIYGMKDNMSVHSRPSLRPKKQSANSQTLF